MKKSLVILAAAVLMVGVAGQANAGYFATGDLIRVTYDLLTNTQGQPVSGYENAVDLGSAAAIEASPSLLTNSGTGTGTANAYNIINGASSSKNLSSNENVIVAYFAVNSLNSNNASEMWTSAAHGSSQTNAGYSSTGTQGGMSQIIQHGYQASSVGGLTNPVVWQSTGSTYSYFKLMDLTVANKGTMGGWYATAQADAFLTKNGNYVGPADQDLFDWTNLSTKQTITGSVELQTTLINGVETTNAIAIPQTAVPVPPSVLLFGSGLLGLFGVGRKRLFN